MKKLLFSFIIAFVLSGVCSAQTVLTYNGGLNFKATQLTGNTPGIYLSPLAQIAFTPIYLQSSGVNFGVNVSVDFAEALSFGSAQPDAPGSPAIDINPDFLIAVFGGDGFGQVVGSNILLNQGVIGLEFGLPSVLGDLLPGIDVDPATGAVQAGFSYTTSFDVLDGLGVVKL